MYYWEKHNFAFFHIMKCAGTTMRNYLRRHLGSDWVRIENPYYHEPLQNKIHLIPEDTKILTCVRNPFELLKSLYRYHRQSPGINNPIWRKQARELDFSTWIKEFYLVDIPGTEIVPRVDFDDLLFVDDKLPKNLHIIKFEGLPNSFFNGMRVLGFNFSMQRLPKNNPTTNREKIQYDKEAEQLVRERFKWAFENLYNNVV